MVGLFKDFIPYIPSNTSSTLRFEQVPPLKNQDWQKSDLLLFM